MHNLVTSNLKQSWVNHMTVCLLCCWSLQEVLCQAIWFSCSPDVAMVSFKDHRSHSSFVIQPSLLSAFPTLPFTLYPPLSPPLFPYVSLMSSSHRSSLLPSSSPLAPLFSPSSSPLAPLLLSSLPLSSVLSYSMWLSFYSVTSFPHAWWSWNTWPSNVQAPHTLPSGDYGVSRPPVEIQETLIIFLYNATLFPSLFVFDPALLHYSVGCVSLQTNGNACHQYIHFNIEPVVRTNNLPVARHQLLPTNWIIVFTFPKVCQGSCLIDSSVFLYNYTSVFPSPQLRKVKEALFPPSLTHSTLSHSCWKVIAFPWRDLNIVLLFYFSKSLLPSLSTPHAGDERIRLEGVSPLFLSLHFPFEVGAL